MSCYRKESHVQRNEVHGPRSHRYRGVGTELRLPDHVFPSHLCWRGRRGPRAKVSLVGAQLNEVQATQPTEAF